MSDLVTCVKRGPVAWVVLDAPKANALTGDLAAAVTDALRAAEADASVGCLALTSAGPNFCGGADLDLLRAVGHDPLVDGNYDEIGRIYDLFGALQNAAIPTLAGIGGHVVGAGVNLALACDLRIVATDVRIRGFLRAGVHPGGGHLSLLARNLNPVTAAAIALFGQELDAAAAVGGGFAVRSVPRHRLNEAVAEVAAGAGTDPELVRRVTATYRAARAGAPLGSDAAVLLERAPQLWSLRRRV